MAGSKRKYLLFSKDDGRPDAMKPCAFFVSAEGCRSGAKCRFSHTSEKSVETIVPAAPVAVAQESSKKPSIPQKEKVVKKPVESETDSDSGSGSDSESSIEAPPVSEVKGKRAKKEEVIHKEQPKEAKKPSGVGEDVQLMVAQQLKTQQIQFEQNLKKQQELYELRIQEQYKQLQQLQQQSPQLQQQQPTPKSDDSKRKRKEETRPAQPQVQPKNTSNTKYKPEPRVLTVPPVPAWAPCDDDDDDETQFLFGAVNAALVGGLNGGTSPSLVLPIAPQSAANRKSPGSQKSGKASAPSVSLPVDLPFATPFSKSAAAHAVASVVVSQKPENPPAKTSAVKVDRGAKKTPVVPAVVVPAVVVAAPTVATAAPFQYSSVEESSPFIDVMDTVRALQTSGTDHATKGPLKKGDKPDSGTTASELSKVLGPR